MENDNVTSKAISRRRALTTLLTTPPIILGLASITDVPQTPHIPARRPGMLNIAMLSYWHVHAQGYAQDAHTNPATQVAAVWDEVPERGRAQASALGVPFYEHLPELLAQSAIDAVIVTTPTTMHRDVLVAAAQAGKHIFTEKVLAPTLHECHQIMAAVNQAGIKLMVSLPRLYNGSTLAIKDILDSKLLGELTQVRTRLCHDGALRTPKNPQGWLPSYFYDPRQTAGGAMIDLGCHPMYLADLFLGLPESVSATYGYLTEREVEDNAVVTLHYPQGTVGIVETSFVNPFSPFSIEAHGTTGSLLYGTPDSKLEIHTASDNWGVEKSIPPDQPSTFQQWISHIQQGTTATANIQAALDLSTLMEAANLSAKSKQLVRIDALQH